MVWSCSKYIIDTTRHFQSEIHLMNKQNNQLNQQKAPSVHKVPPVHSQHPWVQIDNIVELIVNEKTYIKLKVNPSENLEHEINELISSRYIPRSKYQLSYLAKFSKIVRGEEVPERWVNQI